jgi:DNA polymerase-1
MRYMIIDSLNQFLRSLVVNPTLSPNGQPIGGVCGYLKTLQKLTREIKPDRIIICWDGQDGSSRRRAQDKNYKEGRKPLRLNWDNLQTEEETLKNKLWQMGRLMEYMNNMPICQFMFDATEADDIISIVCNELEEEQKVIISSDKDFYQLADDKTIIFRPVQNQIINKKKIIDEFGIHPNNFAISRAICGDNSDNLQGVKGAGLPTIAKRFPFLKEEKSATFDDIYSHCSENKGSVKLFESILSSKDVIQKNYKLMQLYAPSTQPSVKQTVRDSLKEYPQEFNKNEVRKMLMMDGIGELDWSDLFSSMNKITAT